MSRASLRRMDSTIACQTVLGDPQQRGYTDTDDPSDDESEKERQNYRTTPISYDDDVSFFFS